MTSLNDHSYGKAVSVVEFNRDNMIVHDENLKEIFQQDSVKNRKIVAFSTIGAFRKGKSFFLGYCLRFLYANYESTKNLKNKLDDENWMGSSDAPLSGFSWRSGSTRDTSGILMWDDVFLYTVPLTGEQLAIVVFDTQGLFDSETTPVDNSRIFALGTLISSIQVFNLTGTVQEDQLQYLQFATEFASFATQDAEDEHNKPFQNMMFLIRDWVNPDEHAYGLIGGENYLKKLLEIKCAQNEILKSVRKSIRNSFESINCTLLPHPGRNVTSSKAYDGNWGEMDEDFQIELKKIIEHILLPENLVIKQINSKKQNGFNYMEFIKKYFELFQTDELPKAQSVYDATVEKQYNILLEDCMMLFKETLYKNLHLVLHDDHIDVFFENAKNNALITYKNAKKMGGKKHEKKFEILFIEQMEKNFVEWRNSAVANVQKLEEEKVKIQQMIEEKDLVYQEQLKAQENAKQNLTDLKKEEKNLRKEYYEDRKKEYEQRLEAEQKRVAKLKKQKENAEENSRKLKEEIDQLKKAVDKKNNCITS